jgi:PAS domain S-box-containing protein
MGQLADFLKNLFSSNSWPAQFEKELAERKKSELKFKGLLESAPDAMVITNGEGTILMVNAQAERIFGYERNKIIGKEIETLIPERYQKKHVHHRNHYVESPKVRAMGAGMALYGLRKDGSEFPVEVSLSPLKLEDGEFMVMSAIRDISRQKKLKQKLKK